MIIAIDGPSASGKGTLARRLAASPRLGLTSIPASCTAQSAPRLLARGQKPEDRADAERAAADLLPEDSDPDGSAVRSGGRGGLPGSHPSGGPRPAPGLSAPLRRSSLRDGKAGAVLDGRDIATVVCPEADVKVFLTAGLEARAARRLKELRERGEEAIYPRVLQEMQDRDARDSGRAAAAAQAGGRRDRSGHHGDGQ